MDESFKMNLEPSCDVATDGGVPAQTGGALENPVIHFWSLSLPVFYTGMYQFE